jgi:hypothetical protein
LCYGRRAGKGEAVQTIAQTRSIALSDHTRRLVEGYFQLKSLEPTSIKGVTEAVNVYEVLASARCALGCKAPLRAGSHASLGVTPKAERKRALDLAKSSQGQIVAAMAESDVGKPRLFFEFKPVARSGCMVLEALSISLAKRACICR